MQLHSFYVKDIFHLMHIIHLIHINHIDHISSYLINWTNTIHHLKCICKEVIIK